MFYLCGVKLTFVLDLIELLRAAGWIDYAYLLAFGEKDAFHSYVRLNSHDVVVDEIALSDSSLILIPIDHIFEVSLGVRSRRGGQADLNRVKMIERFAPN